MKKETTRTSKNLPRRRGDIKEVPFKPTVKAKSVFYFGILFTLFFLLNIPTVLYSQTPVPAVAGTIGEDAQSLFAKAKGYFNQKNYDQAREALTKFVAEHPLDQMIPRAKLLLARMEQDFNASTKQFAQLAQEYADKPEGEEAQKDLGARFYLADKYGDAALTYGDFLKTHPQSPSAPEARYWYACSLFSLEKYQDAATQFSKVAEDSPESPWAPKALLGLGNTYVKLNVYTQAEKQYLRVLDRYPLFGEMNLVYYRLGRVYELEGKASQAHAAYATLLGQYPRALEAEDARQRMAELEKQNLSLTPVVVASIPSPTAVPRMAPTAIPPPAVTPAGKAEPPQETETTQEINAARPFHIQVGVYSRTKIMAITLKALKKAGFKPKVLKVKTEDMTYPLYRSGWGITPTAPRRRRPPNFSRKKRAWRLSSSKTKNNTSTQRQLSPPSRKVRQERQ